MSKKKSLGHNPLTNTSKNKATLDFIKNKLKDEGETSKQSLSKVPATYQLDETIVAEINKLARESEQSVSEIVNTCLKIYIQENH